MYYFIALSKTPLKETGCMDKKDIHILMQYTTYPIFCSMIPLLKPQPNASDISQY